MFICILCHSPKSSFYSTFEDCTFWSYSHFSPVIRNPCDSGLTPNSLTFASLSYKPILSTQCASFSQAANTVGNVLFNFLRKIDDSLVISIENLRFFNVGKFASETMAEYASLVCVITHSRSLSAVLAVTNAQTQPDRLYMHANTVSCLVPDVITVLVFRADADKLLIVINSRINLHTA